MFHLHFCHFSAIFILHLTALQILAGPNSPRINLIDQTLITKANTLERALEEMRQTRLQEIARGKQPFEEFHGLEASAEYLLTKSENFLRELKKFVAGTEMPRQQLKASENAVRQLLLTEADLAKFEDVLVEINEREKGEKLVKKDYVRILKAFEPLAFPRTENEAGESSSSSQQSHGQSSHGAKTEMEMHPNSPYPTSPSPKLLEELTKMRQKLAEFVENLMLELLMDGPFHRHLVDQLRQSIVEMLAIAVEEDARLEMNQHLRQAFDSAQASLHLMELVDPLPEEFTLKVLRKTSGHEMAQLYEKLAELEVQEAKRKEAKAKYEDEGIALLQTLLGNLGINKAEGTGNEENVENDEFAFGIANLERAMEGENRRIGRKYALLDLRSFYEKRDNFVRVNVFHKIIGHVDNILEPGHLERWHNFDLLNSANNALFSCLSTAITTIPKMDPELQIAAWTLGELVTTQTKSIIQKYAYQPSDNNLLGQWSEFENSVMENANRLMAAYGWMTKLFGWFQHLDKNFASKRKGYGKEVGQKLARDPMQFAELVLDQLIGQWAGEGPRHWH